MAELHKSGRPLNSQLQYISNCYNTYNTYNIYNTYGVILYVTPVNSDMN